MITSQTSKSVFFLNFGRPDWPLVKTFWFIKYVMFFFQTFLHDLIEINGGNSVKLSSRCLVKTTLEASDIGIVSPEIYCDFTLKRTSGDG